MKAGWLKVTLTGGFSSAFRVDRSLFHTAHEVNPRGMTAFA